MFKNMNIVNARQSASIPDRAVFFNKKKDVNYYDTLCHYCAVNDIDLKNVLDEEFDGWAITLEEYPEDFYFWID